MSDRPQRVHIRVPASSANLGPGFDCLAMALDLWNEVEFCVCGETLVIKNSGLTSQYVPETADNMVVQSAKMVYQTAGESFPAGLQIDCTTHIPIRSGLGSSAAAILAGTAGANALLGSPFTPQQLLALAGTLEGHLDNLAAAMHGGLVLVLKHVEGGMVKTYSLPEMLLAIATPLVDLSTGAMRLVITQQVLLSDAVANAASTAAVLDILKSGNLEELGQVMVDRLHQPYRLPLIPGASQALAAARGAGADAVALSGAGPSLLAFCRTRETAELSGLAMVKAFEQASQQASYLVTRPAARGIDINLK